MSAVNVQSPSGDLARTVELPGEIFDVAVNVPLIHQVVVGQLAAARQGTHDTKTRGEVRGGGKKPYRQKGTGRARQGSVRAPQFAGGGIVHGPTPRDYAQRTPKKMKAAALRGALSDRARSGRVHVISALVDAEAPSTKQGVAALARITDSRHVLVVAERHDVLTWKSLRNAAHVHLIAPDQLNTYDVLVSDDVVFTEGALAAFVAGPARAGAADLLGDAVDTLAAESGPQRRAAGPAVAAEPPATEPATTDQPTEDRVTDTPATDAGQTTAAGAGVSDDEAAAQVAGQTSNDLKAEEAFESAAGKDTDAPAAQALDEEMPGGGTE